MTRPRFAHAARWLLAAGTVSAAAGTASAHGTGATGGPHVDLLLALPVVVGLPLLAGVAVVRRPLPTRRAWYLVDALVVLLGALALAGAASMAGAWVVPGALAGALLARSATARLGCGCRGEVAVGALVVHRTVEGLVLAALVSASAALALAGTLALAGHGGLEAVAIAGASRDPRRGLASVALAQAGFLAGVVVGWAALAGVPAAVEWAALAVVGGVLVTVGGGALRDRTDLVAGRTGGPNVSAAADRE
ncbi:hypothetical protein [Halomarina ordinaria]|uniref:Uncharacterized protein n=1 Tax=Halomarina ordinaria TaxID=3033939 RepID=A0ABD5U5W1_9EURY|nr:hypothetical protein [Halomarina sp. PSRA2]